MDTHALSVFNQGTDRPVRAGGPPPPPIFPGEEGYNPWGDVDMLEEELARTATAIQGQVLNFVVSHHRVGNLVGRVVAPRVRGARGTGPVFPPKPGPPRTIGSGRGGEY